MPILGRDELRLQGQNLETAGLDHRGHQRTVGKHHPSVAVVRHTTLITVNGLRTKISGTVQRDQERVAKRAKPFHHPLLLQIGKGVSKYPQKNTPKADNPMSRIEY